MYNEAPPLPACALFRPVRAAKLEKRMMYEREIERREIFLLLASTKIFSHVKKEEIKALLD